MYLKSGAIEENDYKMIAKDYYEKFEKLSGKKCAYRKMSIEALQNGTNNYLSKMIDKNYVTTYNYLQDKSINQFMVSLKDGSYFIAYAVVNFDPFSEENPVYFIDDIIIHEEEHLDNLAEGQINIRYNIYGQIINHLHNTLANTHDHKIRFNMIDSKDLYEALVVRGYTVDNDLDENTLEELINTGNLQLHKDFVLQKEEQDELRLTRKQRKE